MSHESFSQDLKPFMEEFPHKTLVTDSIISVGVKRFRVERWEGDIGHCFVFINISGECSPAFAKTPSYVYNAIKSKKIIVDSHPKYI